MNLPKGLVFSDRWVGICDCSSSDASGDFFAHISSSLIVGYSYPMRQLRVFRLIITVVTIFTSIIVPIYKTHFFLKASKHTAINLPMRPARTAPPRSRTALNRMHSLVYAEDSTSRPIIDNLELQLKTVELQSARLD